MKTKPNGRGRVRPGSDTGKSEYLEIRLSPDEKAAFRDAADMAGLALSAWVRERLRKIATSELQHAGRPVAYLPVK